MPSSNAAAKYRCWKTSTAAAWPVIASGKLPELDGDRHQACFWPLGKLNRSTYGVRRQQRTFYCPTGSQISSSEKTAACSFLINLRKIGKAFHFDGIAGRIQEEHGCLLAGFPGKADAGRKHELDLGACGQYVRQLAPVIHWQDDAQMRHRHHVLAYLAGIGHLEWLTQMQRQLMSEKIDIDPGIGAAPFFASQQIAIEVAGGMQIVDVIGEMEK